MSLLDDVMKNVGGLEGLASFAAKNPQIIAAAATLLSSKDTSVGGNGGLGGLISAFDQNGLGEVMGSWLGSGQNQAIGADQIAKVVGNDALSQFASKAGIGLAEAGPALAAVLPLLIDKLSPQGRAPEPSSLESTLGSLLSGAR
jgi:uncharacterized protein YidB (DUF937 family)